jgi:hypothetical protein
LNLGLRFGLRVRLDLVADVRADHLDAEREALDHLVDEVDAALLV